ncbi:helix-turn-helix domain-containing protein [Hymenobacter sp. 15J16-1T3B]|nr:helix-turn-helix domain-containing protein [Hymenobacter sp. 15J16-1T3B]
MFEAKAAPFSKKADLQAQVLAMWDQGKTYREIEAETGVPRSTIGSWRTKPSP